MAVSYQALYDAYDAVLAEAVRGREEAERPRNQLQAFIQRVHGRGSLGQNGFARIDLCRQALDALDRQGWQRSFHQRMFHENFIRACSRVFFKTDPPGSFARAHQTILDLNGWDTLAQEILISTPRRCEQPAPRVPLVAPRHARDEHPVPPVHQPPVDTDVFVRVRVLPRARGPRRG